MEGRARRHGRALGLGLAAVLALWGCDRSLWATQPALTTTASGSAPPAFLLSPPPSAVPEATPSPGPTAARSDREILPFNAGDRFTYAVMPIWPLTAGKLRMAIQSVRVDEALDEITELTLAYEGQTPQPYRVVLHEGMFHFDGKPFIPLRMALGQMWIAQDGTAQVVGIENLLLPGMPAPFLHCYKVQFTDPDQSMTLWFAPGLGLVKGQFKLGDYFFGNPATLQLVAE